MALASRTFSAGRDGGFTSAAAASWGALAGGASFRRQLAAAAPAAPAAPGAVPDGEALTGPAQALDAPGRLVVANVRLALLRASAAGANGGAGAGAGAADAAAAAAAAGRDRQRLAAAVARLFRPVSVSRSSAAAAPGARGAALLAHYPTAPERGGDGAGAGVSSDGGGGAPLSHARPPSAAGAERGRAASLGGVLRGPRAPRPGSRFGGGGGPRSIKSSMSVASVLSFSSLKDDQGDEADAGARCAPGFGWVVGVGRGGVGVMCRLRQGQWVVMIAGGPWKGWTAAAQPEESRQSRRHAAAAPKARRSTLNPQP
jgi:hypothetical protein